MLTTPFHSRHLALGAKMAPFGGYDMPIQYQGILAEHTAARSGSVIFDTCHMGELLISGTGATVWLDTMLSCRVAGLAPGRCRYGMLCNKAGGVIDDLIVYSRGQDAYMLVVNAGTRAGDVAWLTQHLPPAGVSLQDVSAQTAKLDIQGPTCLPTVTALTGFDASQLRFYRFAEIAIDGADCMISRTGYTGELGFEIYGPPATLQPLWDAALTAGVVPAGLGARDTLRLECGYPLYGHELTDTRPAIQSGFTRAFDMSKEFHGAAALRAPDANLEQLCGIRLDGRRAAREGTVVMSTQGEAIGMVTSGSFAPSLGVAVAVAYCGRAYAETGTVVDLAAGRKTLRGTVVALPFYTAGTARNSPPAQNT